MVHFQIGEEEWALFLEALRVNGYVNASEYFREATRRLIENGSKHLLAPKNVSTGGGNR